MISQKLVPILRILKLFRMALWRDFLVLSRYKENFFFEIVSSAAYGFGMLLFALVFDISSLSKAVGTTNFVAFVVLGFSFQSWSSIALWGASNIIQTELSTGQIDYTFSSPFSRYWYLICNIGSLAVRDTLFFIPMLAVGLWFAGSTLTPFGVILGLLATMLSVATLAQLGAILAALMLRYKQVAGIHNLFYFAFQMLTGTFIPVQILPLPLQVIGLSLPQTFGIDMLRYYVMDTKTIIPIEYEWLLLFGQLIILASITRLTVLYLERKSKEEGLHYT